MLAFDRRKKNITTSLPFQIMAAEQQILDRHHRIDIATAKLTRKLLQQMTAPVSLLSGCGIGFILGEITKDRPQNLHGVADKTVPAEDSPLRIAIKLATSIQTLYTALPVVWIMKTFYQPISAKPSSTRGFRQ